MSRISQCYIVAGKAAEKHERLSDATKQALLTLSHLARTNPVLRTHSASEPQPTSR